MEYCPNCGGDVNPKHHYCGGCGHALSTTAETGGEIPGIRSRRGFLSTASLTYIHELAQNETAVDYDSVEYRQLQEDVRDAFADFAILAMVDDFNLLHLWAAGQTPASDTPVTELEADERENELAALGLGRILHMYDDALGTSFEDELYTLFDKLPDNTDLNNT